MDCLYIVLHVVSTQMDHFGMILHTGNIDITSYPL